MWGKSSHWEVSFEKVVLRNYEDSQEKTCIGVSVLVFNPLVPGGSKRSYVLKNTLQLKETPAQVFSCELCEISKNTFFYRTPEVAAFELLLCPWHIP